MENFSGASKTLVLLRYTIVHMPPGYFGAPIFRCIYCMRIAFSSIDTCRIDMFLCEYISLMKEG
jgi:hypothetical protein